MNALEFRRTVGGDPSVPDKSKLEEAVEGSTTCAVCKGKVRATIEDIARGSSFTAGLDFLVAVRCRNASCAWTARQWRPWARSKPYDL